MKANKQVGAASGKPIHDAKPYAIFDFDGTLVDSTSLWSNLASNYIRSKGLTLSIDIDNIVKTMSLAQAIEYILLHFDLKMTAEEVKTEILKKIEEHYFHHVPLKPFVAEYLDYLKNAGVKMCIATASEYHHVVAALKRLQVEHYFDFVSTCSDLHLGKDDEQFFHEVIKRWDASPSEAIVYEDALHVIETANRIGFYTIGVYDPSAAMDEDLIKKIANQYIFSFKEML